MTIKKMRPLIDGVESFSHAVQRLLDKSPAAGMITSQFDNPLVLCPVIGIAWWICRYKRELLDAKSLRIAILGAETRDAGENGRIYQFLPWLLSTPKLEVEIHLVGPNLKNNSEDSSKGGLNIDRVASNYNGTCGEWWNEEGKNADIDLFVAFNPGLEANGLSWLDDEELPALMKNKIPLAVFSYDYDEAERDRHFLAGYGFRINTETNYCPMSPKFSELGDEEFKEIFSTACFFVEGINESVTDTKVAKEISNLAKAISILHSETGHQLRHSDAFLECWVYRGTKLTQALNVIECVYYDLEKQEIFFSAGGKESADTPPIPIPNSSLTKRLSNLENNVQRACFAADLFDQLRS